MVFEGLVACICEGGSERVILEILIENDLLQFSEEKLLEGEILKCRSAREFEKRHLKKGFCEKITVVRVLDSRSEKFELSKAYRDKVDVVNVITAPEIEMLIIINEGQYSEYEKRKSYMKPSDFCKQMLNIKSVKSPDYIRKYFSNVENLVTAIKLYKHYALVRKGESCLSDLLK